MVRQFSIEEESAFYFDDNTPEITIAVKPRIRRRGVCGLLLNSVMKRLRGAESDCAGSDCA
jgi:hypothetical protein